MIKCTHCMRYFVMDLNSAVENGYVKCPHCGEMVKL
ncbi:MJ0042-type zinc finger domain-containing protein [Aminipila sp.]|nr:MJ0042-type zinc finger domain-containing protein [Aminipila sp.]